MHSTKATEVSEDISKKIKILNESKCKFCDKDETAEHVMCKCEAYASIRQKYFKKPECNLQEFNTLEYENFVKCYKKISRRVWTPDNE